MLLVVDGSHITIFAVRRLAWEAIMFNNACAVQSQCTTELAAQHNPAVLSVLCRTVTLTVHCSVFENQLSAIYDLAVRAITIYTTSIYPSLLEALGLEKQQLIIDIIWNK